MLKKKIYFIQPTYCDRDGHLLKGQSISVHSLALPILSTTIPPDWEKEFCLEYFEDVNYGTDASVIGISSMGYDLGHSIEIAERFKRKGKIVIFGGYQAYFTQNRFRSVCDSVVFGNPGPNEMEKILYDIEKGNIASEYHCGININFPFDYSIFKGKKIQFMPVLASVGCPNQCDYCCTAAIYKGYYRLRNLKHVFADLQVAKKITRYVGFVDSNIYNNRGYLLQLCSLVIKENLGLRWGAQCTIDIGEDQEALHLLKRAGCMILFIGFETIDQSNLDGFGKPYCAERYSELIQRIRKAGISVAGFFMLGLDNDKSSTFDAVFDFIHNTRISAPILNLLLPVPGTKIFDRLRMENRLLIQNEEDYLPVSLLNKTACNRCFFIPKHLSIEEAEMKFIELGRKLSSLKEIFRRSFVLNPLLSIALFAMNFNLRKDFSGMAVIRNEESFHRSPSLAIDVES